MYVRTGTHSVNVATAVQTLLLKFHISGIIFFGSSGSLDKDILMPGDVAVPKAVAFTGVWEWKKFRSENKGKLVFGDFNYPENGENLLGTAEHQKIDLFSTSGEPKEVFWLPISSSWYEAATEELKDLELKKCHSGKCLPGTPKVVFGSKASSSDFYVKNKAYGDFLVEKFNASTADSASAAVALTSLSNEKLFVVFQGVSNVAGGKSSNSGISYLASYNAFLAATKFINSIPTPRLACE
ncbi:PURINE NUCLEOSIDE PHOSPHORYLASE [Salix purpurea]|uniref:PURINE NUCLEOSIDE PHOSPHORYLASE n=1 Tax=Salix purpurea TaxID=77065 RepID=A0A9Q1AA61_SALPP|nr:PURINE NUCLEOSIDE PHOSPHORYLASE [Salix purpurea]